MPEDALFVHAFDYICLSQQLQAGVVPQEQRTLNTDNINVNHYLHAFKLEYRIHILKA